MNPSSLSPLAVRYLNQHLLDLASTAALVDLRNDIAIAARNAGDSNNDVRSVVVGFLDAEIVERQAAIADVDDTSPPPDPGQAHGRYWPNRYVVSGDVHELCRRLDDEVNRDTGPLVILRSPNQTNHTTQENRNQ